MGATKDGSAFLPTARQELLLKACLLDGDDAIAAFRSWRDAADLDDIDAGSIRLLPIVARNLRQLAAEDPSFGIYRGVQRRTWVRNNFLVRGTAQAVQQLYAAGIVDVMALKGIVLMSTCYDGLALRPMADVDLLVRRRDAPRAIDVLHNHGWCLPPSGFRPRLPADFAAAHAHALDDVSNPDVSIDLHWRLLWARFNDDAETELWRRAVRFEIGGAELLAPSAADMLVHVCAHGAGWNAVHPLRWVVDATLLVRSTAIDWTHFVAQTRRLGLALPMVPTLAYLQSTMGVSVPDTVIRDLQQTPATSIEKMLFRMQQTSSEAWDLLSTLRMHHHIARHELAGMQGVRGYWSYFASKRRDRSLTEVAMWVGQKLARRVGS